MLKVKVRPFLNWGGERAKTLARVFHNIINRVILYPFSVENFLGMISCKYIEIQRSEEYAPLKESCHLERKMPEQMLFKFLWYVIFFSIYEGNMKWSACTYIHASGYVQQTVFYNKTAEFFFRALFSVVIKRRLRAKHR